MNRGAADLCIIWIDVLIALTRVRELVCGRTTTTTARENHSARCGTIAPERNEKMYLTPQVVEWSLERSTTFSFVYSIYIFFTSPLSDAINGWRLSLCNRLERRFQPATFSGWRSFPYFHPSGVAPLDWASSYLKNIREHIELSLFSWDLLCLLLSCSFLRQYNPWDTQCVAVTASSTSSPSIHPAPPLRAINLIKIARGRRRRRRRWVDKSHWRARSCPLAYLAITILLEKPLAALQ